MNNETEKTAAASILKAARAAAPEPGLDITSIKLMPESPAHGRPAVCLIAWTVGPAWGELKLEFRQYPMHLIPAGDPRGFWTRVNGTAMTPAGFPMLPALAALLSDVAAAAADRADGCLPDGCPAAATVY